MVPNPCTNGAGSTWPGGEGAETAVFIPAFPFAWTTSGLPRSPTSSIARRSRLSGDDDVGRKTGPVEQLVRLDVVRHGCRTRPKQQGRNDADGEGPADDVDQVQ